MKKLIIVIYTVILNSVFVIAQSNNPCESLPESFSSYEQAQQQVQNAVFKVHESVDTRKSSWIRGLTYYSCDGHVGFFIMKTDSKSYIHENVPIEIWNDLKNADSFGSYYNENIKHNYRISIN